MTQTRLTEVQVKRIVESNADNWNNYIRKYDVCKDCGQNNPNKLIRNPQLRMMNILCIKCFTRLVIRKVHNNQAKIERQKRDGTFNVKDWRLKKEHALKRHKRTEYKLA